MAERPIIKLKKITSSKDQQMLEVVNPKADNESKQPKKETVVMPKKTWQEQYREIKEVIKFLSEKYGDLFDLKNPQKPLKKSIAKDIAKNDFPFSKQRLNKALHFYCYQKKYLQAIVDSEYRYDLSGQFCETISDQEKEYSKDRVSKNNHNARAELKNHVQ
jgi:sRNA-binding protein